MSVWVRLALLLGAVIALTLGWNWHVAHERKIGYDQRVAEEQVERNAELERAKAETTRLAQRAAEAEQKGAEREKQLVVQRDAALAAASGLRNTLADVRRRLSVAPVETISAYADTGLKLLDECQERYRALAERTDGHFNDWKTLDEAWPE